MFEKIKPLHDRILVKIDKEQKSPSGIYLANEEKPQTGEVVSIGSGRLTPDGRTIPLQVKVGDTVFFGKYSGTDAGTNHLIFREEEILGVIEKQ